jgi:hypothetical protein
MIGTTHTRTWLSIGLGLMLAAAITLFTFLAFEDIALAYDDAAQPTLTSSAQR